LQLRNRAKSKGGSVSAQPFISFSLVCTYPAMH
jgi:hypothetical protein